MSQAVAFPSELDVVVEVPRGGLMKRGEGGHIDMISPLPCPFNYGSVFGTRAADGDREDAVLLGPRVRAGDRVRARVVARVRFIDAGVDDAKWVCASAPLSGGARFYIALFFTCYALGKTVLNALNGTRGPTRYLGIELAPD